MSTKKCVEIIEVKLKGEVYKREYGMGDIQRVIDLVNEIHHDEIHIKIIGKKKIKAL